MNCLKFSENLQEALRTKKITQKKLADYLGTTQQTVSRWLNGINEPDFSTLLKVCIFLHETPNDLLGYTEILREVLNH